MHEALHENGYEPDWMIDTSIGAVNASIIAGNEPCDRMQKPKEFCSKISLMVVSGFKPRRSGIICPLHPVWI